MGTLYAPSFLTQLRGKIGGLILSHQPNGAVTVRSVGEVKPPPTPAQIARQNRLRPGHAYVSYLLSQPALREPYKDAAASRRIPTFALMVADFLNKPMVDEIDLSGYTGGMLPTTSGTLAPVGCGHEADAPPASRRKPPLASIPAQGQRMT